MTVVLRFVQRVHPKDMDAFLSVEGRFVAWEKRRGKVVGRRLRTIVGSESVDTFIWEGTFQSRLEAAAALESIETDEEHSSLWSEQVRYVVERRVEILEEIPF